MSETILNIYLIIENDKVVEFKAIPYEHDDGDVIKIKFLKENAVSDFQKAIKFNAPQNKKKEFMTYTQFSKLEKRGMHFQLFEEIFSHFKVPENPLICVTPVVNGKIISE